MSSYGGLHGYVEIGGGSGWLVWFGSVLDRVVWEWWIWEESGRER